MVYEGGWLTEMNVQNDNIARRHTREPFELSEQKAYSLSTSVLFSNTSGRVKIGFVGLAAGVGTTTLCFAAAEYLAAISVNKKRTVTMLELDMRVTAPAGRPYDKIGIDRRFAGREFVSHYRLAAESRPLSNVRNIDGGIHWALRVPDEPGPAPTPSTLNRLVNNAAGDIVLCDISAPGIICGANRDTLVALLADLDHVICVFDLLPSRLLASVPVAEVCRAAASAGVPSTNIFNKLNAGVNLREAIRFTGVKEFLPFYAVSAEEVYSAEYACRSLASNHEIKASLDRLFV